MSTSAREDAAMIEMHDLLARQRAAFMDELPVGIAVRKDRLRRAAAMIVDHATRFCDALSEDFGHRSREQSLVTDIAGSVAPINHAIKHVTAWAARERSDRRRVGKQFVSQGRSRGSASHYKKKK